MHGQFASASANGTAQEGGEAAAAAKMRAAEAMSAEEKREAVFESVARGLLEERERIRSGE